MFIIKRIFEYSISKKTIIDEKSKSFIDSHFIPIMLFVADSGLKIPIPSWVDGSDASFILNQLENKGHHLGRPAEEMALFLHMRFYKTQPVFFEYKPMLSSQQPPHKPT